MGDAYERIKWMLTHLFKYKLEISLMKIAHQSISITASFAYELDSALVNCTWTFMLFDCNRWQFHVHYKTRDQGIEKQKPMTSLISFENA